MVFFHPPPHPPELSADQIRALIKCAEKMAAYMEDEITNANRAGIGHTVLHLPAVVEGWRFTATAISETYDGEY